MTENVKRNYSNVSMSEKYGRFVAGRARIETISTISQINDLSFTDAVPRLIVVGPATRDVWSSVTLRATSNRLITSVLKAVVSARARESNAQIAGSVTRLVRDELSSDTRGCTIFFSDARYERAFFPEEAERIIF